MRSPDKSHASEHLRTNAPKRPDLLDMPCTLSTIVWLVMRQNVHFNQLVRSLWTSLRCTRRTVRNVPRAHTALPKVNSFHQVVEVGSKHAFLTPCNTPKRLNVHIFKDTSPELMLIYSALDARHELSQKYTSNHQGASKFLKRSENRFQVFPEEIFN